MRSSQIIAPTVRRGPPHAHPTGRARLVVCVSFNYLSARKCTQSKIDTYDVLDITFSHFTRKTTREQINTSNKQKVEASTYAYTRLTQNKSYSVTSPVM